MRSSLFISEFENDDKILRINLDGNIDCFATVNNSLNQFNISDESIITKTSVLQTCTCVQKLNKIVNFDYEFKLDSKINKMLSCDSKIIIDDTKCYDGYIVVSGQIINTLMYEIDNSGFSIHELITLASIVEMEGASIALLPYFSPYFSILLYT